VFAKGSKDKFHFIVQQFNMTAQAHLIESKDENDKEGKEMSFESHVSVVVSPLTVNVDPHILSDLNHFITRCQITFLMKDFKQYRPARKPLTGVPAHLA